MGESEPLVSIYVPTHNRSEYLRRALDSIARQTYGSLEVLVCDDGSSDETPAVASEYHDVFRYFRYLRNETPAGACSARNLGIFAASGTFITGLDDDDEFAPDRVQKFIDSWNDDHAFLCANFINRTAGEQDQLNYKDKDLNFEFRDLFVTNEATNQVFTLTSRLREVGGFDVRARRLQDWDTWIRLSHKFGKFKRLGEASYVMHHERTIGKKRVSKAIGVDLAIKDLISRNIEILGKDGVFLLEVFSDICQGRLDFYSCIKALLTTGKISYLKAYFSQKDVEE